MRSRESKEDYLEAILVLRGLHGHCRNIDIAKHLGVTKPSVTNAVSNLYELGLVEISKYDISLTPEGEEIAEYTYRKHKFFETLTLMLKLLLVKRAVWSIVFHRTPLKSSKLA